MQNCPSRAAYHAALKQLLAEYIGPGTTQSLRWQPGTPALPQHVLGQVGTPLSRGSAAGYATAALRDLVLEVGALGLAYIELTTDVHNLTSQSVITANGGGGRTLLQAGGVRSRQAPHPADPSPRSVAGAASQ